MTSPSDEDDVIILDEYDVDVIEEKIHRAACINKNNDNVTSEYLLLKVDDETKISNVYKKSSFLEKIENKNKEYMKENVQNPIVNKKMRISNDNIYNVSNCLQDNYSAHVDNIRKKVIYNEKSDKKLFNVRPVQNLFNPYNKYFKSFLDKKIHNGYRNNNVKNYMELYNNIRFKSDDGKIYEKSAVEHFSIKMPKNHSDKIKLETYFENCSVKIGSFAYFNQEKKIFLSKNGFTFLIPTDSDTCVQLKTLTIGLNDIIRVFIEFSSCTSVLNFFIYSYKADEIIELLNYDYPDLTLPQKISLELSYVDSDTKYVIKKLFESNGMINEVGKICPEDDALDTLILKSFKPLVDEVDLFSNYLRIGKYRSNYVKIRLSKNEYKMELPIMKSDSSKTKRLKLQIDLGKIIICKSHVSNNFKMIYFELMEEFAKSVQLCLAANSFEYHEYSSLNFRVEKMEERVVFFLLKIEDDQFMSLLQLLHESKAKLITKEDAQEIFGSLIT